MRRFEIAVLDKAIFSSRMVIDTSLAVRWPLRGAFHVSYWVNFI